MIYSSSNISKIAPTWPCVRHGQQERLLMLALKILVFKLLAIDRLAACTIARREVSTLQHEGFYDAVEGGALVVEGYASGAITLLAGAESPEVLCGLGDDWGGGLGAGYGGFGSCVLTIVVLSKS